MDKFYKAIRAVIVTMIVLAVVLSALTYVGLSLPYVQDKIRKRVEKELSEKLGAEVIVGKLIIRPFNRVIARDVALVCEGDTAAKLSRLGAGINLYRLLRGKMVLNYAEIIGLDVRLRRDSLGGPLNIEPMIEALTSPDSTGTKLKLDMRINSIVARRSSFTYDIADQPSTPEVFNPSHIALSDIRADISIPRISEKQCIVDLRRFALSDASGFAIDDMRGIFELGADGISVTDFEISLPQSEILFRDIRVTPAQMLAHAAGRRTTIGLGLKPGSHIYLPSLGAFVPQLRTVPMTLNLDINAALGDDFVDIERFDVSDSQGSLALSIAEGHIISDGRSAVPTIDFPDLSLRVGGKMAAIAKSIWPSVYFPDLPQGIKIDGAASGNIDSGRAVMAATAGEGKVDVDLKWHRSHKYSPLALKLDLKADEFDLADPLGRTDIGNLDGTVVANVILGKQIEGNAEIDLNRFTWRTNPIERISAKATFRDNVYDGTLLMSDDAGFIDVSFDGSIAPGDETLHASASVADLSPSLLRLTDSTEGYRIGLTASVDIEGRLPSRGYGTINLRDISLTSADNRRLAIDSIRLITDATDVPRSISLRSDIVDGDIIGDFDFASLVPSMRSAALRAFSIFAQEPEIASSQSPYFSDNRSSELEEMPGINRFDFSFTIRRTQRLSEFFGWPAAAVYPVSIDGLVDTNRRYAQLTVDAPFITMGKKLIEGTSLEAVVDGEEGIDKVYFTTQMPTANGLMTVTADVTGADDVIDTGLRWHIDRERLYEGAISLHSALRRADTSEDDKRPLVVDTRVNQSEIVFNDSVWTIHPATILYTAPRDIAVDNLNVSHKGQYVKICGNVSPDPSDSLVVDLNHLNLDYVFESLGISVVMLGGDATGRITASSLFDSAPQLLTDGIDVRGISYNSCVMGDAIVKSHWDAERQSVVIDGDITGLDGQPSKIVANIFALRDSLDLDITANHAPIGFLQPFMKAFSDGVDGYGSGHAHLWGTFSDLDIEGRLVAEPMRMRLDFTNVWYSTTDSVKLDPGIIYLDDLTISDALGHTARLNGYVTHEHFHEPCFDFTVSDVDGMLVYDEPPSPNALWYGRIFADGVARVVGNTDKIAIDIDAGTTGNSTFTFVLSDIEEADEYTFLTFRDRAALQERERLQAVDEDMAIVESLRRLAKGGDEGSSADYVISINVDVNPQSEIVLVMDPIAGDKIKAHGSGNLRMVYSSADNDLSMLGKYTIERGTYNFTLQDIIIKDFTINPGSELSFSGDPMAARLDIEAAYQLNANLSDLDESFLSDKDLNRTNVPVQALLRVRGDLREPEITFDLAFPTLTSDIYRKVRSIISTDEMMNQQILYLLALNRFYTPDYMSATKGSELFSVASSTLSSQLTNMLGHLSNNWAIAPNLRSSRGDFSDVEVDVALSSRLLNNRLLLNGNFGYRDPSLNTNRFVGDFEIEYLLNRAGSIRLKGYNHYNDQNYYLRQAATTQGVGVLLRRDFDRIDSFLHPRRKKAPANEPMSEVSNDSIPAVTQQ